MVQSVDNVALLPAYLAAGTVLFVLLVDLFSPRAVLPVAAAGATATAVGAGLLGRGADRATFCVGGGTDLSAHPPPLKPETCSYVADNTAALIAVLFALLTLAVLVLSAPLLASGAVPTGEYCFLLASAMTGGVVLGYAGDLITLIVALETLTLPLYVLVGLRRRSVASAEGAVTFFVVSVVATSVTLLGAALLYALTGAVHLNALATALAERTELRDIPLTAAAVVLVLAGLAFKVAAVPFHAWAPAAYDGAPIPIAAYLSTASKLGGVVAILYVAVTGLRPWLDVAGPALAALAVLTMTVGNLVALRQRRMVRLLAWSSVAQAGYILAPLGAFVAADGRTADALGVAATATVAYTVFYVVLELAAFGSVIALRPAGDAGGARFRQPPTRPGAQPASDGGDGGEIADYRGAARRAPWVGGAFVLALVGLAGLPPGLAGLFAKVAVVRSLLGGGAGWLAVVVALNAVVGLAYYVRVAAVLFGTTEAPRVRVPWAVAGALGVITLVAVVVGFAPQLVLDAADLVTTR